MAKIIAMFNHKGGVSKTTTTFNLGWMLAEKGARVILADFDPQCNLTGMVLGFRGVEDLENTYKSNPANNVRDALAPAFESQPRQIEGAECFEVEGNDRLFLLAGHIGLAEYETTLGIAQELTGSLLALRNLPGSLHYMLQQTAEKYEADYIFLDMSPSLGPVNQNLISICDFFIVPLHPDYFSTMALNSLSRTLPRWRRWAESAHALQVLQEADYPFPKPKSEFIGAIVQKYRPKYGKASKAFQKWIDQLVAGLQHELIPSMEAAGLLHSDRFRVRVEQEPYEPIMEVADFNSLIAESQDHQVPVYALTAEMLKQGGAVWDQTEESMAVFRDAFASCADKVIALTAD